MVAAQTTVAKAKGNWIQTSVILY